MIINKYKLYEIFQYGENSYNVFNSFILEKNIIIGWYYSLWYYIGEYLSLSICILLISLYVWITPFIFNFKKVKLIESVDSIEEVEVETVDKDASIIDNEGFSMDDLRELMYVDAYSELFAEYYAKIIDFLFLLKQEIENFLLIYYVTPKWLSIKSELIDIQNSRELQLHNNVQSFEERWYQWVLDFAVANCVFLVLFFAIISLFMLSIGAKLISTNSSNRDMLFAVYSYFDDWEEELGSLDDALYYFIIVSIVILWYYFITLLHAYINIFTKNINILTGFLLLICSSGVIIPGAVLKSMGIYFVQYVRGAGRTTNLFFEIMLDVIAVSIIMIRFFLQNIRFVFIFFAFYELYAYIGKNLDDVAHYSTSLIFNTYVHNNMSTQFEYVVYKVGYISDILLQWVLYLYYLGHLTILFIMQLSIYFILSFWLFFFLYTTFLLQPAEKYFIYRRYA